MENYLFGQDGSFALGFRFYLPEKYSLGENDFDLLNDIWSKALRDLPIGTIFFKQDIFQEKKFDTSTFSNRNFLEHSTKNYFQGIDYLSQETNLLILMISILMIYISVPLNFLYLHI